MTRSTDALELLTMQHAEIDALLVQLSLPAGAADRPRLVGALADQLTTHLALESELLYPHVSEAVAAPLEVGDLVAETEEIRRVIAALLTCEDAAAAPLVAELGSLLRGHVAWQEEVMFERIAESTADGVLQRLGAELGSRAEASRCISLAA